MTGCRIFRAMGGSSRTPARAPFRVAALLFAVLLGLAGPGLVFGQETASKAGDPGRKYKPRLLMLPIIYYTPETRLAMGAGGVLNYRLGRDKENTRPSSLWILMVYTLNKQIQLGLKPEIYLPHNFFIMSANLQYEWFPQAFYGIGNDVSASAAESYTPETKGIQLSVKRKIFGSVFGGIQYQIKKTIIQKIAPGGLLASGDILGSAGGVTSSLGLSFNWDDRDNVLFPRRGSYLQFVADFYSDALGSDYHYTASRFDLRTYIPVRETDVVALQAFVRNMGGNPPFYELSMLGGAYLMRGTYTGQYRDKSLLAFQAEYRMHVWKRIGAAAFAGLGDVAPTLREIKLNRLKFSLGAGLRFKLDTREGTNLRLDFAWGKHSTGFYMTVQEAF
ncbi:MAG: BamA/TamA family outer membrane protein [Candidatus Aminicenantales bacterium]